METKVDKKLSQSARFETAFNRIHKVLRKNVKNANTDKFSELVHKGKSHIIIRYYEPDLLQFAKLRNAIVHEKIDLDYYIAEPHIDIVEKIERIADDFEKPRTALSISSKEVYYFHNDDSITDVLACIKKKAHSRFPIYDSNEKFSWLLTTKEIINWLSHHFDDPNMNLKNISIKDLKDNNNESKVCFVSQNTTVFEIEDIFEEDQKNKRKLDAVLITKSGKETEKPNGIITSWDLLEVELEES